LGDKYKVTSNSITFVDCPPRLYRAFEKLEHAQNFLNGIIRLGSLNEYRKTEDGNRSDPTEGYGRIFQTGKVDIITIHPNNSITKKSDESGLIHHQITSLDDIYVLSLSYPLNEDINHLRKKYGSHIVQINQANLFIQHLRDAIEKSTTGSVEFVKIIYNKDEESAEKIHKNSRLKLAYAQKHKKFEADQEYRLVYITQVPEPKNDSHIEIELPTPLAHARIL
jgi:hypothetical protein